MGRKAVTRKTGKLIFMGLIGLSLSMGGCRILETPVTATPEVIIITATPERPPDTATPSPVPSPVLAAVELITRTPLFPTATNTARPTLEPTLTPTFTPTNTESPTPPGGGNTIGLNPLGTPLMSAGGTVPLPVGACTGSASGGFAAIAALDTALGCAVGSAIPVNSAMQQFEGGRMIWVSSLGEIPGGAIYVLYNTGAVQRYADTWLEGVDSVEAPGGAGAPAGKSAPIRGFGKVWGINASVRTALGWALGPEQGMPATIQRFAQGELIFVGGVGQTLVVNNASGQYRFDPTPY
ncbi:MAG: hypothetical protein IT322_07970 [Anaerolineae bacterium]|nr:hypothetical protein [Anaerolineae bacterium]CAG0970619.1 hypothetical protein ANRL4_01236 [Anaerolineae bacterium]